jgi:phosphatidylglycerol:prolipoprotein diacylglycerol transferase
MTLINYLIWNGSPEIFKIGSITLRWYGLFFALGFLISQQILYYIFSKEGKPQKDVDTLTIYMVIATIIGARLGHVFFYEPQRYLANPIDIIKIWEGGLASHGATIGILFALWLYARKKKPGQSYLQTVDRIVILVALTGALIRFGNYFNSEIIGKPTTKPWGVVFVNRLTDAATSKRNDTERIVDFISYTKNQKEKTDSTHFKPLDIGVYFKPKTTQAQVDTYMKYVFKNLIVGNYSEFFYVAPGRIQHEVVQLSDGTFAAYIKVFGISRHPAQLYEAFSCIILFIALFLIWNHYKQNLPSGMLLGIFLIVCFGLRFLYEYLKEPQVDFENNMSLYMGQILSIPLVIAGVIILLLSFKKKEPEIPETK